MCCLLSRFCCLSTLILSFVNRRVRHSVVFFFPRHLSNDLCPQQVLGKMLCPTLSCAILLGHPVCPRIFPLT